MILDEIPDDLFAALRQWLALRRAIYQTRQQVRRLRVWRG